MSNIVNVHKQLKDGRTKTLEYWNYHCAKCGTPNMKRVLKQHHGKSPQYCNQKCFKGSSTNYERDIEAYQLWNEGQGLTLQAIGTKLGGVTRERARQLVNKGRIYSNNNSIDK